MHKILASHREKVAVEFFAALSQEEKDGWEQLSKEEHDEVIQKWEREVNGPISEDPADRQR